MTLKRIIENKLITGMIIAAITLLVAWSVWVTDGVYKADKVQEISKTMVTSICVDIDQLRKADEGFKLELKDQRELIHSNQITIMDKLMDIHKSVKAGKRGERE